MIGAIVGDIVGSRFEWHNNKSKKFKLFTQECKFTDDTIMTLAIAKALLSCGDYCEDLELCAIKYMQEIGREYPSNLYGGLFRKWLMEDKPRPYGSYGNGSAMRVSACAYVANSLDEVKYLSKAVSEVTHNHPEGIKGAEAIAVAIFLARMGKSKDEIREYIITNYYQIDFTIDSIRAEYKFNATCQGSVPHALEAFFEAEDFEDTIRNAVSIGGDSDTVAAMAGSVAEAYYGVPDWIRSEVMNYLDSRLFRLLYQFEVLYPPKVAE